MVELVYIFRCALLAVIGQFHSEHHIAYLLESTCQASQNGETLTLLTLLEGDYFAVCRIVVECIAKPLNFAHSRIFNSYLILPKCKR